VVKYLWVCTVLALVSCSQQDEWAELESTEFTRAAVQPSWFSKTESFPLTSLNEVSELWRSHKRCCDDDRGVLRSNREFYKSCYRAIQSKPTDADVAPYCLWLMDTALEYEHSTLLSKYLLKQYPNYKRPVDNCANCSTGDLIARVTRDVALYEHNRMSLTLEAINRLEAVLINRHGEISPWVLGEIYVSLSDMYLKLPYSAKRLEQFQSWLGELELIWPKDENQQWRIEKVREAYKKLLGADE